MPKETNTIEPLILQNDQIHETLKEIASTGDHQLLKEDELVDAVKELTKTTEHILLQNEEKRGEISVVVEGGETTFYKGEKGEKGDTGERGPTGPEGRRGIMGDKGDTGERGVDGVDGKDGKNGRVGLRGPKGDRGERGPRGEPGISGVNGENGRDVDPEKVKEIEAKADFAVGRASKTVALIELEDVSIEGPTNGQTLTYDGSTRVWRNTSPTSTTTYDETPTGTIDGLNTTFNTTQTITFIYGIYMNGQHIAKSQYSSLGTTITFVTAPDISYAGLDFSVVYK